MQANEVLLKKTLLEIAVQKLSICDWSLETTSQEARRLLKMNFYKINPKYYRLFFHWYFYLCPSSHLNNIIVCWYAFERDFSFFYTNTFSCYSFLIIRQRAVLFEILFKGSCCKTGCPLVQYIVFNLLLDFVDNILTNINGFMIYETIFKTTFDLNRQYQVFFCEICEIFKNTYFYRTPPLTPSVMSIYSFILTNIFIFVTTHKSLIWNLN